MLKGFIAGVRHALAGFSLALTPGIRRYALIPLLINAVLFALLGYVSFRQFGMLLDWMLPDWLDFARYLLWPLFAAVLLISGFFLFSLLANLVAAPFNALLTARLVAHLQPNAAKPAPQGLLRLCVSSIGSELRKLRYQALWALPLLLLTLIPVANLAAPFGWLLYGAWMMAIEYLDYPLGEAGLSFPEQRVLLKRRRGLTLGFGLTVLLLSAVPLLNFVVIPAAVAGATGLWAQRLASPRRATTGGSVL